MSYKKAMKFARNPCKGKPQYMGFALLGPNERRREPWLGSAWFAPDKDDEARRRFIEAYHAETARMLQENPNLKLVD